MGVLLRRWRQRRGVSQLDLSIEVGVSTRHLSFVETGRSRPSAEMVLTLAQGLGVPLRERNTLLLAAGYAPRFPARALDDADLAPARAAVQRLLDAHDPYPGVVIDRCWNVLGMNAAAAALTAGLPDEVLGPPANVYRLCLHPNGLAARTVNFAQWAGHLLQQVQRTVAVTDDDTVRALLAEVRSYPTVTAMVDTALPADTAATDDGAVLDDRTGVPVVPPVLVPWVLDIDGGQRLSLFSSLTSFGAPGDVTLDELAVELFFPSDEATAALLTGAAGRRWART